MDEWEGKISGNKGFSMTRNSLVYERENEKYEEKIAGSHWGRYRLTQKLWFLSQSVTSPVTHFERPHSKSPSG
jgi:hypothetical protein